MRNGINFVGCGSILDQLKPLIAINHLARRRGDVFAQLEWFLVDLANHAIVMYQIIIGVLQTFDQA